MYAQLTDEAIAKTWYTSSDKDVTTTVTPASINSVLADKNKIDQALVWRDGMTYYYYPLAELDL